MKVLPSLAAAVLFVVAALPGAAPAQVPALPAPAPTIAPTPAAPAVILTPAQALAQDAASVAERYHLPPDEALRQLQAQEDSVPVTDGIGESYRDRLAGIAIEHAPAFRIVVLLTGTAPVADRFVTAGGMLVPVVFRTGALATRERILAAIHDHQADIRAALPHPPGLGVDPHTGELVVMVQQVDADLLGVDDLSTRFATLTGVPVRLVVLDRPDLNLAVEGGARVEGISAQDGHRYACTTGFTVTDGTRTGVITAAHCPDTLSYIGRDRHPVLLPFVGQWGWGYQDVQVNVSDQALDPLFYADSAKTAARPVTALRARSSTRAGDVVCHRGERTGYSCAEVLLTDFAPAGDLCGGACLPTWVAVAGPGCKGGDSGGPVFSGSVAFGIVKGASYRPDGTCNFYYYMSTDYLPPGWSLLRQPTPPAVISLPAPPPPGTALQ